MTASLLPVARFAFAAAIWLLPGFALVRWLDPRWRRDPVFVTAAAFATAAGISTLLAWKALLLGIPAREFPVFLGAAAVLAAVSFLLPRPRFLDSPAPRSSAEDPPESSFLDRPGLALALAAVVSLLALAFWAWHVGATLRYTSDAPDHIGTLREILRSGAYFPSDALYRDAGLLGMDARKGLLHPVYAALSALAGLDPADFWVRLPAVTVLFPFLGGYGFLRLSGFSSRESLLGGSAVLLTWSGGPGRDLIGISPFPNNLGATLSWLAAGALIALVRRPSRSAVALAVTTSFAAAAVHPMFSIFLALSYGLLGFWALFLSPRRRDSVRGLIIAAAWTAVLAGPYFVYRYRFYAPGNPIHTELQGMLLLGHGWFVADPERMWIHIGWAGLVAYPILFVLALRRWRRGPAAFYFLTAAVVMPFVTFNPFLVPFLQKTITYLIFRSFWFLPPGLAAAVCLAWLWHPERENRGERESSPEPVSRPAAVPRAGSRWAALLLAAAVLLPALRTAPAWLTPFRVRDGRLSPLPWREPLQRMKALLPPRAVVLADPITSHVLPAFTGLKVAAPYDQHSPPNDTLAVVRILRVRDVLSPSISPAEARRLVRESGADAVLFNFTLKNPPLTDYWMFSRSVLRERERELAGSPYFARLGREAGFVLLGALPSPGKTTADASGPASPPSAEAGNRFERWALPGGVPSAEQLIAELKHWADRQGIERVRFRGGYYWRRRETGRRFARPTDVSPPGESLLDSGD